MTNRRYSFIAILLLCLALAPCALSAGEAAESSSPDDGPALQVVPAVKVCMVNDQLFERDQIPVEVEGKTYYGCCEMCKQRLATDVAIRHAVDPLTGDEVDKATAVMAADAEGKIFYFASEENLAAYLEAGAEDAGSDG